MAVDKKFLEQHGYQEGSYENRLASLGIQPNQNKSGKNVNPNEFAKYVQGYQQDIKTDPSKAIAGYGNVDKAYEEAKSTYLDMLPSLQPRYQNLLTQLQGEQEVAQARNVQQSGAEETALKNEIAKRGLGVNTGDTFFAGQSNKLQEGQNLRAKETDLGFSRERLMTEEQRGKEETAIRTAVAGLTTEKANALQNILTTEKSLIASITDRAASDRQYATSLQFDTDRAKALDEQWKKTFDATRSETAAGLAIEQARLALSQKGEESDFAGDMLSLTSNIWDSPNKFAGMKQATEDYLVSKYPNKTEVIKKQLNEYLPEGWESQGGSSIAPETKKVMDELGVDQVTAEKLIQQEAGL